MLRSLLALAAAAVLGLSLAPVGDAAGGAAINTHHGKLGTFLVDGKGRTLYLFQKDKPRRSSCSGACAGDWPPVLTTAKPSGSGAARKSLLGTIKRGDGKRQVTYNGHPLYRYVGDSAPGDTNGQGVSAYGARWYAVASSGRRLGGGY
jgi:predicted lipoprotein with Yx(FWY)xxD motif